MTNSEYYLRLLTKISRKIRRTLDLETIWQQTVNSLGEALKVSRCLLLEEAIEVNKFDVKAEYCEPSYPSMLGMRLEMNQYSFFKRS